MTSTECRIAVLRAAGIGVLVWEVSRVVGSFIAFRVLFRRGEVDGPVLGWIASPIAGLVVATLLMAFAPSLARRVPRGASPRAALFRLPELLFGGWAAIQAGRTLPRVLLPEDAAVYFSTMVSFRDRSALPVLCLALYAAVAVFLWIGLGSLGRWCRVTFGQPPTHD